MHQKMDLEKISAEADKNIGVYSLSTKAEIFLRLKKNPVAWVCFICLTIIFTGAIFVPLISKQDYASQNIAFANIGFFSKDPMKGYMHYFGTDHLGRDIFVRAWFSVRISMIVAISVTFIDCFIGVVYGSISGYVGGIVDTIMMRVLEVINGIPYLVVVLLLMVVFPRGLITIIVAYSITGWTGTARLVRGQVLNLRKQEFILASRAMGAGVVHILKYGILPNILNLVIVSITLDIPTVIFTEAFLSMLGLGIEPPMPSLGIMVNDGIAVFTTYPWELAVPAVFIGVIMLCFNLFGDCLQDAIEPVKKGGGIFGKATKRRRLKGEF